MEVKLNLNDVVEYEDFEIEMRIDEDGEPTLSVRSKTGQIIVRLDGGRSSITIANNKDDK